jgi:hypothetical protein
VSTEKELSIHCSYSSLINGLTGGKNKPTILAQTSADLFIGSKNVKTGFGSAPASNQIVFPERGEQSGQ